MSLKVGYWNINGLGEEKLKDIDFVSIVTEYDIICLTETWWGSTNNNQNVNNIPPGYTAIKNNRKRKNKKAKRNSGGILVLYKKNSTEVYKVT